MNQISIEQLDDFCTIRTVDRAVAYMYGFVINGDEATLFIAEESRIVGCLGVDEIGSLGTDNSYRFDLVDHDAGAWSMTGDRRSLMDRAKTLFKVISSLTNLLGDKKVQENLTHIYKICGLEEC